MMDISIKKENMIPGLLYGLDKTGTPKPIQCDLNGQLIIAGQVPTVGSGLDDASGGGGGTGGIIEKVERTIYPVATHAGVATWYSNEFQSHARNLAVYVDLLVVPGAVNFTPTVQVRHIGSNTFVDLISFGAIAGVVGLYRLATPLYDYRFRMSFALAAGAWTWAAYIVENF